MYVYYTKQAGYNAKRRKGDGINRMNENAERVRKKVQEVDNAMHCIYSIGIAIEMCV